MKRTLMDSGMYALFHLQQGQCFPALLEFHVLQQGSYITKLEVKPSAVKRQASVRKQA